MGCAPKQLNLIEPDGSIPTLKKYKPAHRKAVAAGRQVVEQVHLELKEKRFLPVLEVPQTRADCPPKSERSDGRCCDRIRCFWNLAVELASDRAGRPGLSKVPRGHRGWTLSVDGDIGEERAETTLRPIWLGYGWSAKASLERDDDGNITSVEFVDGVNGPQLGRWNAMDVEEGEVLEVWWEGERLGTCQVNADGAIVFDRPVKGVMVEIKRQGEQPSCGLDVIERGGPRTTKEVGLAIGRSASLVRKITRRALIKLRQAGMSGDDLEALIGSGDDK